MRFLCIAGDIRSAGIVAMLLAIACCGCSPYGYGWRWARCSWVCPPLSGCYPVLVYQDDGLGPVKPAQSTVDESVQDASSDSATVPVSVPAVSAASPRPAAPLPSTEFPALRPIQTPGSKVKAVLADKEL